MSRPERCRGCREKLRPGKATVADYPGTVAHHGHGYCTTCNTERRHHIKEAEKQGQPLDDEILERMRVFDPSMYRRIIKRRKDWIPAGGWRTIAGVTHG